MYCKYCGTEIDQNSRFCKNCGKRLEEKVESKKLNEKMHFVFYKIKNNLLNLNVKARSFLQKKNVNKKTAIIISIVTVVIISSTITGVILCNQSKSSKKTYGETNQSYDSYNTEKTDSNGMRSYTDSELEAIAATSLYSKLCSNDSYSRLALEKTTYSIGTIKKEGSHWVVHKSSKNGQ